MRRVKKSRNGCARCKSKRVKCGEEKPHCTRCTRLGVRCPGYAQSLRWVTKYEQSSPTVPASISEVRTPSPAASASPGPSQPVTQIDDALPEDSTFETHEPDPPNFVLDSRTSLCDNLWEHPSHGSLPELTDLCSPSPMPASPSFTHQRDTFRDFEVLPKNDSNNYRFFEEALIYWEMLLSFVADNDTMVLSNNSRTASSIGESFVLQRVPHPWTGIARDTQFTVHEVGQLIRRERKRIRSRRFTSQDDITRAQLAIEKARELEERLLGLAHPSEAEIVSPGDDDTPVWHLLTMAEAYRCVGLMQLYRVFPDLLHKRLPTPISTTSQYPDNADAASRDPFFPIDLDSMDLSARFGGPSPATGQNTKSQRTAASPSRRSSSHNLPSPSSPDTQQSPTPEILYSNWLTEFAVTTLSRLKTIPLESRTRCLQPFLLVASCSELRLPRLATNAGTQARNGEDYPEGRDKDSYNPNQTPTISMEAIEVSRTRKFILGRLTSFLHVLPPKPIHICLKLVNEVWRRLDAGDDDTYWVDVMIEKGWETTMG
ncbi:transcriptional regulator family: Fungal Specific TF [Penicillium roqueforti]|nr:transcriptional regulator family: Fungal Specific TF [Penicillium roqueforti]